MKSVGLTVAVGLALFAAVGANAESAFLRVGNKFGDYWIFRFAGHTINLRYDIDHRMQKDSDREMRIEDIDFSRSLPAGAAQAVFRPQGGNLAKIRLFCKTPGCVYSHFDTNRYEELDVLCERAEDCVTFVQSLPLP
jgi:hypothetical protein